eukprot:TRINITY_DN13121_c0_g1_i1.p1 TRINITY_DN13121_c0_g1~~TRINITY_DN13121_c0_g1_i1.p1  ORF type:complete len:318 (-),score=63.00 TRINITY_DN13121_c0_g1_i1:493-1446(-)
MAIGIDPWKPQFAEADALNAEEAQEPILEVPPKFAMFFNEDMMDHIRVQAKEFGWKRPKDKVLFALLEMVREGKKAAVLDASERGARISKDSRGVFIHREHQRKYFGLVRSKCPSALKAAVPDPMAHRGSEHEHKLKQAAQDHQSDRTDHFLGKLLIGLPTLTDNVREDVLRNTFRAIDTNGNGKLSRMEILDMMRKVRPIGGQEISNIMVEAGDDEEGLSFSEWLNWLNTKAHPTIREGIKDAYSSPAQCIQATFRVWDKNGDGTISRRELDIVMKKLNPRMTESQISAICNVIDVDHDGQVDYQEFVHFLFPRPT